MLAMNGNTATYMQYAYARVRSILHKGGIDPAALRAAGGTVQVREPAERALALALLRFPEALEAVVADYRPNQLTAYLFDLANQYSTFYENCPVLKAPDEATRASRLVLCDLVARTIEQGLALLGIGVVEKM
jgi:arginyl-tRNA synthetase